MISTYFSIEFIIRIFLRTSLFTALLSLLQSTGTVFNLSTFTLPTSTFNLAKLDFNARLNVSIPVDFLNLFLLHN